MDSFELFKDAIDSAARDCALDRDVISLLSQEHTINEANQDVMQKLASLVNLCAATRKDVAFNAPPLLTKQYSQSDCYILAEHLLYSFANHTSENIANINYIHIAENFSVHGLVSVKSDHGTTVYVDAIGIFHDIDTILARYGLSNDKVRIFSYNASDILEGDNDRICQLTALTDTDAFLRNIRENYPDVDDVEDMFLNSLLHQLISKTHYELITECHPSKPEDCVSTPDKNDEHLSMGGFDF